MPVIPPYLHLQRLWQSYILQINETNGLTLTLATPPILDGIWRSIPDSNDISLNQWYHLSATFDKQTGYAAIYLNGKKLNTVARSDFGAPTTINADTDGLKIGCEYSSYNGYWQFWHGKLDDIRIYSRAISANEIDSLFHEGGWLPTSVENLTISSIPDQYSISQNYPNPFNPSTTIKFAIPEAALVKLTVYDILGRQVAILVNQQLSAGYYNQTFNASALSSGAYFYRIYATSSTNAGHTFTDVKKLLLLK